MSLDRYKVFNLIEDVSALKVLMILESPYVNEYIHGHPAAGESALELTNFLQSQGYVNDFDAQLPVGCNIKTLRYKSLGILNCSTLPMNGAFYPCTLVSNDLKQVNQLIDIKQSLNQSNLQKKHQIWWKVKCIETLPIVYPKYLSKPHLILLSCLVVILLLDLSVLLERAIKNLCLFLMACHIPLRLIGMLR